MATITVAEEARRTRAGDGTSFYVPLFEVHIADSGLPKDVLRDIVKIVYKDDLKSLDNVTLTVNNWDATTNRFKYVGSETEKTLKGSTPESKRFRLFEPCSQQVEVKMGYLNNLVTLLTGQFVALSPTFSAAAPTLEVTALNALFALRRKRYTTPWPKKKISEIAADLNSRKDEGKPRFPLPIVTSDTARKKETPIDHISQDNQYDIDFLYALAREYGYVVFIEEKTQQHPRQLYFGPSDGKRPSGMRDDVFKFEWGKSLMEFKPTLATTHVYKSVTVRGWHQGTYSCIKETVTLEELNCNEDLVRLLGCAEPREEKVVKEPVFSRQQARSRARAILLDSLKEMVTAKVKIMGMADIRAGRRVLIEGVGSRFSGTYFVTDTTHTIDDNGYITDFGARRENDCGGGP